MLPGRCHPDHGLLTPHRANYCQSNQQRQDHSKHDVHPFIRVTSPVDAALTAASTGLTGMGGSRPAVPPLRRIYLHEPSPPTEAAAIVCTRVFQQSPIEEKEGAEHVAKEFGWGPSETHSAFMSTWVLPRCFEDYTTPTRSAAPRLVGTLLRPVALIRMAFSTLRLPR